MPLKLLNIVSLQTPILYETSFLFYLFPYLVRRVPKSYKIPSLNNSALSFIYILKDRKNKQIVKLYRDRQKVNTDKGDRYIMGSLSYVDMK